MINILMSRGNLAKTEFVEVLSKYLKKDHKVAVVCLSYFTFMFKSKKEYESYYDKGGEYYEKMLEAFAPYGIFENAITIVLEDDKAAESKIEKADIIYFPGGAPDLFMERIKKMGLKDLLENKDKIYIGSSAGAMIQLKNFHISRDNEYHKFSYQNGLDLLAGFHIEVHYNRRRVQKSGMRNIFRKYREPIYVLPDDGLIVVENNKVTPYFTARQKYNKKGVIRKP